MSVVEKFSKMDDLTKINIEKKNKKTRHGIQKLIFASSIILMLYLKFTCIFIRKLKHNAKIITKIKNHRCIYNYHIHINRKKCPRTLECTINGYVLFNKIFCGTVEDVQIRRDKDECIYLGKK